MLIIELRMAIGFLKHSLISSQHMFLLVSVLGATPTAYKSHIGALLRKASEEGGLPYFLA